MPKRIDITNQSFYVYVLFRENGQPFYVGKGCGRRWLNHEKDARAGAEGYRFEIIRRMQARNIEVPKIKLHEGLIAQTALEYEIALIAAIGRRPDGPLANLTAGGDGLLDPSPDTRAKFRSRILSSETRAKISASRIGKPLSVETRAKISAAHRGETKSLKHREKIGAAHRGKVASPETIAKMRKPKSPEHMAKVAASLRGKKHTSEHCAKIAAAGIGRKHSPDAIAKMRGSKSEEHRAKISAGLRGHTMPAELRAKLLAAHVGKAQTPETRAKISAGLLRAAAKRRSLTAYFTPMP